MPEQSENLSVAPGTGLSSQASPAVRYPTVSVIIPARNEAQHIESDIRSILANDYPPELLEVIVVDGMSEDATGEIARRVAQEDPRVHYVQNSKRITPAAFNVGVRASKGEVIFIVGGHAMVTPSFLRLSVEALQSQPEAWCAGGSIETISTSYVGRCIAAAMSSPVGVGNSMFRLGSYKGFVATVAFGAYWRWVFDKIGYFDEELLRNQDDDFNQRVLQAGGKIYLDSDIKSTYFGRSSLRKLTRQYYDYGFYRIRTLQKHRRPLKFRQVVPLLFVSVLLMSLVSALLWRPLRYHLAGLTALYALGLAGGVVDVTRRKGLRYALLSPLVFVILHFGYGIGNLAGIWRFIVCDRDGVPRLAKAMPVAVLVAVATLAGVAGIDFLMEPKISLNFLYFLPLAVFVILLGRTAGVFCALCASALLLVDQMLASPDPPTAILIWNAVMRLGTLLLVCYLIDAWWRPTGPPVEGTRESWWRALCDFLGQRGGKAVGPGQTLLRAALIYVPLAAVVYVDYITGPDIALSFFYTLPVFLAVAWRRSVAGGLFCACCSSLAFLTVQLLADGNWSIALWNAGMRVAALITVAFLTWKALAATWTRAKRTIQPAAE